MEPVPADWYEHFFVGGWFKVARQAEEKTKEETSFLVDVLGLSEGDRVLDVACGIGRHSLELARRGLDVVGVDLNGPSLEIARRAAAEEGLSVEFIERDMRAIDFTDRFDAAINMWTSFGFFETEVEDREVLRRVKAALRPGGAFLLDMLNPLWLVRHFEPFDVHEFEDGTLLIQRRAYDLFSGRVENEWTFVQPGGEREKRSFSTRAYTMPELLSMLDASDFEIAGSWGDFDGGELGSDARRLILLGRKR